MKNKMMRAMWLGVWVVMAGCASGELLAPKTGNAEIPAPEPGTQAYYEQKIKGRYALDAGELLALPSTATTRSKRLRDVASPGLRPLPSGVYLPSGSASPRWTEGRVLQVVSTNMIAIGKAVTNASGAVTFPQDCLVKLNGRRPTPNVGDWFRAPTMPDGDYSCTVEVENTERPLRGTVESSTIKGYQSAPGFRELAEPTYEEYRQIYERDCQAAKVVDPIVFVERITNAPPILGGPTRMSRPLASSASPTGIVPAAPVVRPSSRLPVPVQQPITMPYDYTITNNAVTITKYNGPGGRVMVTNAIDGLPVTVIGRNAFGSRQDVYDVILSDTVTSIEDEAFTGCSALTNITISASVIRIADSAFRDCKSLQSILVDVLNPVYSSSADGILFNMEKTEILRYPQGKSGDYTIPGRVTSIGSFAFRDCTALTRVQLPSGLTNIGDWAFGNCTNLTDIVLAPHFARLEEYFRIGINGWQIAAMLVKAKDEGRQEQIKKYGCAFVRRDEAWFAEPEQGASACPLLDPEKDPVVFWLNQLDLLADKWGVFIRRRQVRETVIVEAKSELPILCKEWEGTLESFAEFLNGLRQQGFMIDVESVSMELSPQREDICRGSFAVLCAYRGGSLPTPIQAPLPAAAPSQP